ncbi:AraC family transcriptional regulator [Mesoterricola sediminis]|uniref:AraC family transcriptional regulator n=1 Tax=Mesoterricola sediminis TaxID=2927980 RepID=A0AA48H6M9_9BACT|nr:AraC family transcriptional regulator [Mesoterricola sediminis]BDU78346.1 AraC family transcriptional regulator [Mesoterricola sediminis]
MDVRPLPDLARLRELIQASAPCDGAFELRVPGVFASRVSRAQKAWHHAVQRPALCLVAQGAKRVTLGAEAYDYDANRMLVYAVDVPIMAQVTEAPYLGLRLDLDPQRICALTAQVHPQGLPAAPEGRAICVDAADPALLNAILRLVELAARPGDSDLIAPLVMDEILIRLLGSPLGRRVASAGLENSRTHRVSQALSWVRAHFDQPLDVARLAALAHMSPSSFHQHFKAVTSMSPLQYQKALRLQEARRLMLLADLDAGSAGRRVGYQSPSQFTREYGRYFGDAPTRDIARLRRVPEPQDRGPAD